MQHSLFREPPQRKLGDITKLIRRIVSSKTGIIKSVGEIPIEQDDPLVFLSATVMSDTSRYSLHMCNTRNGGAGCTKEEALAAGVGEAIERYCSNFYNHQDFILSSYQELEFEAVHPKQFILFSERQYNLEGFPFQPFTEASKTYWTWGYSLIDQTSKLVPACFTYLPYVCSKEESLLGPSISTGLACGGSLEESILKGIYECIERDAFTIMWLNKLSMPVVDIRDNDHEIGQLFFDKFATSNIDYCVCDITSDIGVPSFYTLAIGNSSVGMIASVGSATHLNAGEAIKKTLVESAQGRQYVRSLLRKEPDWSCGENFKNLRSFDEHARLYSSMPELISKLEFVKQTPTRSLKSLPNLSTGTIIGDIELCLNILAEKGLDVLVVDLTTCDVAEVGLRVVRVIIPGLQPLHGDHLFPFLGGERLYQVPKNLGYTQRNTTENELYPWPHPFP